MHKSCIKNYDIIEYKIICYVLHMKIYMSHNYILITQITALAIIKLLKQLNNHYMLPEVYTTENAYADIGKIANNGEIVDVNRIIYLRQYISQVMKAT